MSFLELVAWATWENTRPRKLATLALVALAGPAFALLLRALMSPFDPDVAYGLVVPLGVYSFSLVLLTTVFASGVVSSEMTGRTIPFLLTRPVPRWKILLAKWLSAAFIVSLAVMGAALLTAFIAYGGPNLAHSPLARDLLILPVGAVAYCSLFTLFSVLSTKPWIIAICFGFLWESWVPSMPGDLRQISIMSYLRALSPHLERSSGGGIEEFLSSVNATEISQLQAWNTLALLTVVALAIAAGLFTTCEFVPKEETV